MVEDGLLKEYDYEKSDESAEDLEPAHTEEVPQNCKNAYISVSGYLIEILGGDDGVDTICILDPDRKEILSRKITNFSGSAVDDYVLSSQLVRRNMFCIIMQKNGKLQELIWVTSPGRITFQAIHFFAVVTKVLLWWIILPER